MQEHNILAPKIFSNDSLFLQKQILNIVKEKPTRGLEIALDKHHKFSPEIEYEIQNIAIYKKILNLWQEKIYLTGLINDETDIFKNFFYEKNYAGQLNINQAVICNNKIQIPLPFDTTNIESIKQYAHQSFNTLSYVYNKGLKLHVKNTFENHYFFEIFFNEVIKSKMNQSVGFCLDTGNVHFSTQDTLDKWLSLIHWLDSEKISVHYHINFNAGQLHQKLSLSEASKLGLLEPNSSWTPHGYLSWLKSAFITTPNAIFCQEHCSLKAKENFQYLNNLFENNIFNLH